MLSMIEGVFLVIESVSSGDILSFLASGFFLRCNNKQCVLCLMLAGTTTQLWKVTHYFCLMDEKQRHRGLSNYLLSNEAAAAVKLLQSCQTLCDPTDGSPPGSPPTPVPGILQARMLEWVAISFSNAWKWKVKVKSLSHVQLLATPWTAAHQAPPSMGFSRQEYWSGMPLPSPVLCILMMLSHFSRVCLCATP